MPACGVMISKRMIGFIKEGIRAVARVAEVKGGNGSCLVHRGKSSPPPPQPRRRQFPCSQRAKEMLLRTPRLFRAWSAVPGRWVN